MALTSKRGSFTITAAGGTGNKQIDTGTGVVGKYIKFWATRQAAEGFAAGQAAGLGCAVSSSSRACIAWASDDNVATSNVAEGINATKCLRLFASGTPTTDMEVDFVSFDTAGDAGKFTINVTDAPAADVIVHYIFWGGDSLTNVVLLQKAQSVSTGNVAYTGAGFKGDAMELFGTVQTTLADAVGVGAWYGAAVSASERAAFSWSEVDASTMTGVHKHYHTPTKCVAMLTLAGAADSEADLVSFDTDGFTLNWTNAAAGASIFFAAIFKGPAFDVQQIRAPATAIAQALTTGFDMAGGGVFFFGTGQTTADATVAVEAHCCFGAMGASGENATWDSADDTINTDSNMSTVTTKVMRVATNPSTVAAEADYTSLDSTGYTVTWTTTRTNSCFYGLAIGKPYHLAGVTKDKTGSAKATCEVFLLKYPTATTPVLVAYQQSDGSGNYDFRSLKDNDAKYQVVSWKDDSPHVFDVTDHVLQPVAE